MGGEPKFAPGEDPFESRVESVEFDGVDLTDYLAEEGLIWMGTEFDDEVDSDGKGWEPSDLGFTELVHGTYEPFSISDSGEIFLIVEGQPRHWWSLKRRILYYPVHFGWVWTLGVPTFKDVWRWKR